MANLELVPKLPVLVVQAGIFLVNLAIVKKLYVDPYLSVRDRREKMTIGGKDDAVRFLQEAEALSKQIADKLSAAADVARKERDETRAKAMTKRQSLIDAASSESRAQVDAVEKRIRAELQEERAKVPQIVKSLTDEVYKIALA